jgi:hypothetical protein
MVGLAADGDFPTQAEPGQIFGDGGLKFGPAAGGVDVLDAQDEAAAAILRRPRRGQGRIGVAAMQIAAGRRREPGNGFSDAAAWRT